MRSLAYSLIVVGCCVTFSCSSSPPPALVTWAIDCTVYCGDQQSAATGVLCRYQGENPQTAAQDGVDGCEIFAACGALSAQCTCSATEVGESCESLGQMLSFNDGSSVNWSDPCAGSCLSGEFCQDDPGGAYCMPLADCAAPYSVCYYSDGSAGCTDLENDPLNCGSCGHACLGASVCTLGTCQ